MMVISPNLVKAYPPQPSVSESIMFSTLPRHLFSLLHLSVTLSIPHHSDQHHKIDRKHENVLFHYRELNYVAKKGISLRGGCVAPTVCA